MKCAWASIDERGKAKGGKAGDQTKGEVKIGNWYYFGQNIIIRPKSSSMANKIAENAKAIAKNNHIGYDQNQRLTMYTAWHRIGLSKSPSLIKTKCETDCSAMASACIISAGARINQACVTWNLADACKVTGKFTFLRDRKYLNSGDYLKKGDIVLAESHHVIIAIENGSKVAKSTTAKKAKPKKTSEKPMLPTLPKRGYFQKGDKGINVKRLQNFLNWYGGYGLAVDGILGSATEHGIIKFQKSRKIKADGLFGKKSLAEAKKV